jgi:NRPS condensation-like uncharacterized protein
MLGGSISSSVRAPDTSLTTVPLNLLDELYLNLDREAEPWTVHHELRVTTELDPDRLLNAVAAAAAQHPLARARLAGWRFQDRSYDWEIAHELDHVPLKVVACGDEGALACEREQLFSTSPSLATAPPFAMLLGRCSDGDALMLNLHHAAGDAISAARLMLSIMRAYAGEPDPVPTLDPLAVHDVRDLAAVRSVGELAARSRALLAGAWRPLHQTARVACDGGNGRPAYGFELFSMSGDESVKLFASRPPCATVNDVLLGALALAICRWNAAHRHGGQPIALSMPVNLRPSEWRLEVFSNFAAWVTVWVRPKPGEALSPVVERVAAVTGEIKRERLGGVAVDLLRVPGRLTIASKRWLQYLKTLTGDVVVDTASLSNLGSLGALPPPFDAPGTAAWFSPPSQMPLGVAIGALTLGDRLHVALRYRHAQFDRVAARRFMELYRAALLS